jgi:hypothetical protein
MLLLLLWLSFVAADAAVDTVNLSLVVLLWLLAAFQPLFAAVVDCHRCHCCCHCL